MVRRLRMVLISMRVPEAMRDELNALAAEASAATGRKVSRAEIHRSITAEGIRRARTAARYVGRLASEGPTGPSTGTPQQEGAP